MFKYRLAPVWLKLKAHMLPVLILCGVTSVFSLSMLFCPHSLETFGHDAGIFAYIGYALTQGRVLYTGAWDNKGPLLYFIDALGIIIHYRYGIFLLECLSLFLTLLFMYKTAKLFVPRYIAVISAVLAVMPLTATLEGGNLSEEWALPFTAAAFYLIAKFYLNAYRLKKYEMMAVGACIAAIVLLRLNIIMFIAVAVLGVIITLVRKKQFQRLLITAGFALLGFCLFLAPFLIYLIKTDSLAACLDTAYFGVVGSFSELSFFKTITNISAMVFGFVNSGGFFIIILFILIFPFYIYTTRGTDTPLRTLLWICFWGLFATLLGNSVSGAHHMHYFMSFIPVMLLPIAWFAAAIYQFLAANHAGSFAKNAAVAALAFLISINSVAVLRNNILGNLRDGAIPRDSFSHIKVRNFIAENTSPEDTVLLLDEDEAVTAYYSARRLAASNYFYYANGRFSDESKAVFAEKIFEDIKANKPKLLFFDKKKLDDFRAHLPFPEELDVYLQANYQLTENDFSALIYLRRENTEA